MEKRRAAKTFGALTVVRLLLIRDPRLLLTCINSIKNNMPCLPLAFQLLCNRCASSVQQPQPRRAQNSRHALFRQ